ncbi:3-dehydroquinate synthase [bacterium]|nr:3-dehydroquinate synthase [bacterium]
MNKLDIFSDKESYELFFNAPDKVLTDILHNTKVVIIDKKVFALYATKLILDIENVIFIDAFEDNKRPDTALNICEQLLQKGVTRSDTIVAIGGGITQDLVTFAASILFRGLKWIWFPTTLLAQADSCIGGKSSLNFKSWKNILGNFYPPHKIYVQDYFLNTLSDDDIRSGIGEILKVHLLSGKESAELIISQMQDCRNNLAAMIFSSLQLKNNILEIDPLDQGLRLKMNYGHSFGHALESATHFAIPHGIAVTIGLDIANYIAYKSSKISSQEFTRLHEVLDSNLKEKDFISFDFADFIGALKKDKKNTNAEYRFIIPSSFGEVQVTAFHMQEKIELLLQEYFKEFYKKVK